MKTFMGMMLLVTLMASCKGGPQQVSGVYLNIKTGVETALVDGCAGLPAVEVLSELVIPFLPAGTTTTGVQNFIAANTPVAEQLCAKVQAAVNAGYAVPMVSQPTARMQARMVRPKKPS